MEIGSDSECLMFIRAEQTIIITYLLEIDRIGAHITIPLQSVRAANVSALTYELGA